MSLSTIGQILDEGHFANIDFEAQSSWWRELPLEQFEIAGIPIRNRYLLAPMCGVSNLPYRILARAEGAALVSTEMVSSTELEKGRKRSFELVEFLPIEEPVMVQISGTEADVMLKAALMVQDYGATILNLNCGCPVKKVIKGGSGAAMLRNPEVLRSILQRLRPDLEMPLTVKMRAGWNEQNVNALEVAQMCEDCGVDALMLHPRTRDQFYEGNADWDLIAQVKEAVSIPVIGNGDIFSAQDAHEMLEHTGCDAIMIGRHAIGNPWIFRQCVLEEINRSKTSSAFGLPDSFPSSEERLQTILTHFDYFCAYLGQRLALNSLRKQFLIYLKDEPGFELFRERLARIRSRDDLEKAVGLALEPRK
jgi:tRNA-dihydrouridine synthase B